MNLFDALVVIFLYALIRATDIAIVAGVGRDYVRAIVYGILAIIAIITLFGHASPIIVK
jgi:energy-converting hydrogenase Eha subunit H